MPKVHNYHKEMEKHVRKQKLREVRKKMRPNSAPDKPRRRDWEDLQDDEMDAPELYTDERVMPRGSAERRKMISQIAQKTPYQPGVKAASEDDEDEPEHFPDTLQGTVMEVTSGRCKVGLDGQVLECSLRGALLAQESDFTTLVAVGDEVMVSQAEEGVGVVEQVLPRHSMLARIHRPDQGKISGLYQMIAANVDRVLIVAAWRKPKLWPELVDRYLIAAQRNHLDAAICINKIDLVEDQRELEETIQPYRDLGYPVLLTSAETGAGIPALRELLIGEVSVLAGLSGVGKSSLLSQVQPGLVLRALTVGERGKNKNQGRHTTTMATMYPFEAGGAVIDTPGIREFALSDLPRSELRQYYPEFASANGDCRFQDCSHIQEPDCAVRVGVAQGSISQLRYENYQKIYASLND